MHDLNIIIRRNDDAAKRLLGEDYFQEQAAEIQTLIEGNKDEPETSKETSQTS